MKKPAKRSGPERIRLGRRVWYRIDSRDTPDLVSAVKVTHQRNGITGCPFSVVLFDLRAEGHADTRFVGLVLDEEDSKALGYTAVFVLNVGMLFADDIGAMRDKTGKFIFENNAWRGDVFARALRAIIADHERAEKRLLTKELRAIPAPK